MIDGWDNEDPEMQAIFMARGPGMIVEFSRMTLTIVFSIQNGAEDCPYRNSRRLSGSFWTQRKS